MLIFEKIQIQKQLQHTLALKKMNIIFLKICLLYTRSMQTRAAYCTVLYSVYSGGLFEGFCYI